VLLGVVADFSVVVGERRLLHEEMFPVVELAAALMRWLGDLDRGIATDFSYESMESAEGPLLQFLRHDAGWIVRSPLQDTEQGCALTTGEVRRAAHQFVEGVQRSAAAQLSLEVGRWISF